VSVVHRNDNGGDEEDDNGLDVVIASAVVEVVNGALASLAHIVQQ